MTASVLVIEDDVSMRRVLRTALIGQGYRVWEAGTAAQGLATFSTRAPQAVLLDLGLPDEDGFEVLTRVRVTSEVPIVVISARNAEGDQVRALDEGANDYVTKPFREAELFARLRAAIRSAARAAPLSEVLVVGDLRLQLFERRVFLRGKEIILTRTEFDVLRVMARVAGQIVTHRQLLRDVWGPECIHNVEYLRVFMRQLRQKLEQEPSKPQLLITAPGIGYRLKGPE